MFGIEKSRYRLIIHHDNVIIRTMKRLLLCLLLIIMVGCSKDKPEKWTPLTIDTVIISKNHPAIKNMVKKARQIALIKWETLDSVPTLASYYLPKSTVYGIPYLLLISEHRLTAIS